MAEKIDNYGRKQMLETPALPNKIDSSTSGVVYIAYAPLGSDYLIHRYTTASGITTLEKAVGAWSSRATLTYVAISSGIEV